MGHGSRDWYEDATPPLRCCDACAYISRDFWVLALSRSSCSAMSASMRSRLREMAMLPPPARPGDGLQCCLCAPPPAWRWQGLARAGVRVSPSASPTRMLADLRSCLLAGFH